MILSGVVNFSCHLEFTPYSCFQVLEYIMKYVVQSRVLFVRYEISAEIMVYLGNWELREL